MSETPKTVKKVINTYSYHKETRKNKLFGIPWLPNVQVFIGKIFGNGNQSLNYRINLRRNNCKTSLLNQLQPKQYHYIQTIMVQNSSNRF